MPQEKRIQLVVSVNLDSTPGTFHTEESARESISGILKNQIPHYEPTVVSMDFYETAKEVGFVL